MKDTAFQVFDALSTLMAFVASVTQKITLWQERLVCNPDCFKEIESEVVACFKDGAGMVLVGLIAKTMKQKSFEQNAQKIRQQYALPLTEGVKRRMSVRVAGGFEFEVATDFCEVRKSVPREKDERLPGLDIEMSQFGFTKSDSPHLQSHVARTVVRCNSIDAATEELSQQGILLDPKTVRRIAMTCGENALNLRERELSAFKDGTLPAGTLLKGLHVAVSIDGGRTRIRSGATEIEQSLTPPIAPDASVLKDQPGRFKRRKAKKRKIEFSWREPKLVRIFVHDENGELVKKMDSTIDGTFGGPDQLASIVSMRLHQLGVAQATSVVFLGDGAPWIWERTKSILEACNTPVTVPMTEVVDCCHAVQHVSDAIKALGYQNDEYRTLYHTLRTKLRNGDWRGVLDRLEQLESDLPETLTQDRQDDFSREKNYIRSHGEKGRLDYLRFSLSGIPVGSGAIESSIRRVINQRLKGNGMHWRAETAESMLHLRSILLSGNWEKTLQSSRLSMQKDGRPDFKLAFAEVAKKLEAPDKKQSKPVKLTA